VFNILNDSDIEILAKGVIHILENLGFHCANEEILKAYEKGGAKVDYQGQVAKFPGKMIEDFIKEVRDTDKSLWYGKLKGQNKEAMYSGYNPYECTTAFKAPRLPYMFHNTSPYFYDDGTGEKRLGNREDFIKLIKLGDGIHQSIGMGHALLLSDVPSAIEPLEAAYTLLEYSNNPSGVYVHDVEQINYLLEIEAIAGINNPYWHWMANICPNSPLKLDRVVAKRLLYMVKSGIYPMKLAAMPICGVNIPVTTSGTIIIVSAEFIAVWLAAWLLSDKKIPLTGMPVLGTMDVKSGAVNFTAFDAAIRRLAICDFMRKWTGIMLSPGPGEWSPTQTPGMYCTLEKAYFSMIATAFTGHHPEIGVGHIDAGGAISCVQFLLDYDFTKGLGFLEAPDISEQELCLNSIKDIGFAMSETYMLDNYTLDNLNRCTWRPQFFGRSGWTPENEQKLLAQAKVKVKEILAEHKKPDQMQDKLPKIREVIESAKKKLSD